jgi:hypothetical protein
MTANNIGGRCRWYQVGTERVQGRWERNLAVKMTELKINWTKQNQQALKFLDASGKVRRYTPDFWLTDAAFYLELKGYWWGNDREKMHFVFEQHPEKHIIIIEEQLYRTLLKVTSQQEFFSYLA